MKARHSSICTVALLVAAIALSGCSSKKLQPAFEPVYDDPYSFEAYLENRKKADRSSMSQEERFAYDNRTASLSTMRESGIPLPNLHLIEQAKTALGTPYVPGGTDTQGFDCSGFVQWAYRNVGVTLPRTAREQSVMGRPIKSGSMMAGDIVAFNHPRRGYHTGIYLGGGSFIHSPDAAKAYPSPPCPIYSAPPSSVPGQGIRRQPSKAHGTGLPQTHPHPQGRYRSLRYAKTNVRSGSRTPDTGRYPPQGVSPARKTGTRAEQKKRRASRCRPETDDAFTSDSQSRNENHPPEKGSTRETGGPSPNSPKGCRIRKKHPGFGTGQGQNRTRQGGEEGQGGTARRREKSSSGQG
ncbi:NlpC/P60 family protein [Bilophila wadsworthia]|uniref:C40 family peptidase n=1 Tax=Bilophila wadsworthia TaxID=35833 RepID=UPI00399C62F1